MTTIRLHYNGTLEDLNKVIEKSYKSFPFFSTYNRDIYTMETNIVNNFDKYSKYSHIYFTSLVLINESINNINVSYEFMYSNSYDKSLYSPDSFKFLLILLLVFIVLTVVLLLYCYFLEIDIYKYVFSIF